MDGWKRAFITISRHIRVIKLDKSIMAVNTAALTITID